MQIEIMKIDGPEEKQYCEEKLSHRSPPGHKARPRVLLTIISRGKVGEWRQNTTNEGMGIHPYLIRV